MRVYMVIQNNSRGFVSALPLEESHIYI